MKCKVGDLVEVISNTNGHNYKIGSIYKILSLSGKTVRACDPNNAGFAGNNLYILDIQLVEQSKEALKHEAKELQKQLRVINDKIAFMEDNDLDTYDAREFAILQALKIIDSTDDNVARTKQIIDMWDSLSK